MLVVLMDIMVERTAMVMKMVRMAMWPLMRMMVRMVVVMAMMVVFLATPLLFPLFLIIVSGARRKKYASVLALLCSHACILLPLRS